MQYLPNFGGSTGMGYAIQSLSCLFGTAYSLADCQFNAATCALDHSVRLLFACPGADARPVWPPRRMTPGWTALFSA